MKIWYSGFSSQGDGACFTGFYSYAKDCLKAVKAYAPLDTELHSIAQRLQDVQRRHFYGLTANLTHGGRYYHENSISFDVTDGMHEYSNLNADTEDTICEALRDFMRWIYSSLEREYEYETSMAAFLECAEANEYEFTENGRRA